MVAGTMSRKQIPASINPGEASNRSDILGLAGASLIPRGSLYQSQRDIWPAVDVTNGPLTADPGITATAPSTTGMKFYQWDSGVFNKQSQNWEVVPASNGPTLGTAVQNSTTDRGPYYSTGMGTASISDVEIITDSTKVILQYYMNLTGMAGINTSYHEIHMVVELRGQMKQIREAPALWPSGSGGSGIWYRANNFLEPRSRRMRYILSPNCWLMGIWVDTNANIMKAPNRPLDADFGNSWAEPNGNVFNAFGGNGSVAGVGVANASVILSNVSISTHFDNWICGNSRAPRWNAMDQQQWRHYRN